MRRCATTAVIDGCTAFAEETLACNCEETGDAWQMSVVAHSAPTVYVLNGSSRTLDHELRHIADIHTELEVLMEALTSRRFGSQSDCVEAGRRAEDRFGDQMNALRVQSQQRYR